MKITMSELLGPTQGVSVSAHAAGAAFELKRLGLAPVTEKALRELATSGRAYRVPPKSLAGMRNAQVKLRGVVDKYALPVKIRGLHRIPLELMPLYSVESNAARREFEAAKVEFLAAYPDLLCEQREAWRRQLPAVYATLRDPTVSEYEFVETVLERLRGLALSPAKMEAGWNVTISLSTDDEAAEARATIVAMSQALTGRILRLSKATLKGLVDGSRPKGCLPKTLRNAAAGYRVVLKFMPPEEAGNLAKAVEQIEAVAQWAEDARATGEISLVEGRAALLELDNLLNPETGQEESEEAPEAPAADPFSEAA